MTGERTALTGPLGRRLLAAFLLVAFSSVAVLTVAALVATDRGLASAERQDRRRVAGQVAATVADVYTRSGGWAGADLSAAAARAEVAGARLVVRDTGGVMVWPSHGMGRMSHSQDVVEAAATVRGKRVGSVLLTFDSGTPQGRTVAWSWVAGAAMAALLAGVVVSAFVVRRLVHPLTALAVAAHRFASGERTARAGLAAPGELGDVARAFDTMADEVVRAEAVRRRLAADIAHELRTPLAGLQAGLEELRDGLQPADPARLAALHDDSLRLGRVVQDLADLSAAESAALSLRLADADLAAIAAAALRAQRPLLDAAGLTVTAGLDTRVPVRADADRLHQAVANLLANAARYGRPGDRVHLAAQAAGNTAVLTVADSGPGVAPDELPHVFERLWRGRDAAGISGSGIGLAVVRELVVAHGGTVAMDAPAGCGATVSIRLPLAVPAAGDRS